MTESRALLARTAELASGYLDSLPDRRVGGPVDLAALRAALGGPLPEAGSDAASTVEWLAAGAAPGLVASAGPRYFGFVIGGSVPAALAGDWLTSAWDQNAGLYVISPAAAVAEEVAGDWLIDLLGLPDGTTVGFVTGATMANFTGLAAGRHAVLRSAGWDVEADGLFGAPPITVVVGAEAHTTVHKALGLLGLGRKRVVTVPVDGQGRMRAGALPALAGPTMVCVQAGNVNSGAFDPPEVIARAREAGAWVHVDGAFGLWAPASPARAHLFEGYALADSWATDAHKWLNVPYDSGLAFVRDAAALRAAFSIRAAYLVHATEFDPMDHTPESSRRARGIEVWAALRSLGRAGLRDLVERTCKHASRFAQGLRAAGYEVLNDVVLNQVVVAFGDDAATRRAIAALQQAGVCWCGGTRWRGREAMRVSISSWATTQSDMEATLESIRASADA
jgi:glutamate/tyrosine decarboxylase-like PLP-dependent enzyme